MKKFIFIISFCCISSIAWADELWITPAADPADTAIGDWAATSSADTHFSFAVPDDYAGLVSVKVVMIGKLDKDTTADVFLSIGENAARHDDFTDAVLGIPLSSFEGELAEMEVSSVFPALNAGTDYASVHFTAKFVRVVGLRFTYDSIVAGDLAAETAARIAGDAALQSAINSEAATRRTGDAALQSAIAAGDTELQSAINSEAATRIARDAALQSAIAAGDTALQSALNSEAATRIAGDAALQSAIASEEAARISADASHASNPNAHHSPFVLDLYTVVAYGKSVAQCEDDDDLAVNGGTICLTDTPTVVTASYPCCTNDAGNEIATCGTLPWVTRPSWCSRCSMLTLEHEAPKLPAVSGLITLVGSDMRTYVTCARF